MKINPIHSKKLSASTFGLQIDKAFDTVISRAKAEVFDGGYINPVVWHHTQNAVKRIRRTFPNGVLSFRDSGYGIVPVLQPYGKLPYYKKSMTEKPATVELKTVLLEQGAICGRDIRNLATELIELEEKLIRTSKSRKRG